jgi:hypothetical protein
LDQILSSELPEDCRTSTLLLTTSYFVPKTKTFAGLAPSASPSDSKAREPVAACRPLLSVLVGVTLLGWSCLFMPVHALTVIWLAYD